MRPSRDTLLFHGGMLALLLGWGAMVARTGRWPSGDGPHLLGTAMRLSQLLHDFELLTFGWCFQSLLAPHPPGAYVLATAAYTVVGTGRWVHLVAGGAAVWLAADGIRRAGGGWPGVLLFLCAPIVWLQAENYVADLLAAAAVAQATGWLVASERLSRRGAAIAWGAWLGLGFLTKYTAPFFLALPCLAAGWWVLRERRYVNLLWATGAFAVLAGLWYGAKLDQIAGYVRASGDADNPLLTNKDLLTGPWWGAERQRWYLGVLLDLYGVAGVVALAGGIVVWKRRKDAPAGAWLLPLLAFAGGWVLLTMQAQRQDRYLLPALPLLAMLAGSGLLRWFTAPVAGLLLYVTAQTFASTAPAPPTSDYRHPWETAGSTFPEVMEAFVPTSLDPGEYRLDPLLAKLREAQGRDEGTVGALLDEGAGSPGFGVLLSRIAGAGYRWHLATVMLLDRPMREREHAVFVGPFTTDRWPSREFSALVAIYREGDTRREQWLAKNGFTRIHTEPLARHLTGSVWTRTTPLPAVANP